MSIGIRSRKDLEHLVKTAQSYAVIKEMDESEITADNIFKVQTFGRVCAQLINYDHSFLKVIAKIMRGLPGQLAWERILILVNSNFVSAFDDILEFNAEVEFTGVRFNNRELQQCQETVEILFGESADLIKSRIAVQLYADLHDETVYVFAPIGSAFEDPIPEDDIPF